MATILDSPGSSSDLIHFVVLVGNSGNFLEPGNGEMFHSC